ncbi:unnamed protein product [Cunninghamella echinulata]
MTNKSTDSISTNYSVENELTVVANNNNNNKQYSPESLDLEKLPTETYGSHPHHYQMEKLETIPTNMDAASVLNPVNVEFYDDIPNGGYGWFIALAGFLSNFTLFGLASIWGVFSKEFATGVLAGKATTTELMGVGSVSIACLNLMTPFNPMLARFGTHFIMILGTILMVVGACTAGLSTEVWHLYLSQGVVFGCGASLVYMSVVAVIPQWFTTKRGQAMGLSSAGTGIGGLALSPMASSLIIKYSIKYAYLIIGLMGGGILLIATALIRTRFPKPPMNDKIRSPIKLSMLKDVNFVIWLFGAVISLMGYFAPLFYLPTYGASIGLDSTTTSNLVGICCAMNAVGRLVLGWVADRIGRLNMYIISNIIAGLLCCILWKYAVRYEILLAFSILWGFHCGMYFALAPPITGTIVGIENISSGLSILFVASSISSVSPCIASAIQSATPNNGYIGVQEFSGCTYLLGAIICIILKLKLTKSFFSFI